MRLTWDAIYMLYFVLDRKIPISGMNLRRLLIDDRDNAKSVG